MSKFSAILKQIKKTVWDEGLWAPTWTDKFYATNPHLDNRVIKVERPFPWPPPPPQKSYPPLAKPVPPTPDPPSRQKIYLGSGGIEDQKSVYDWCMEMYPRGGTPYGFATSILEEAVELARAAGLTDMDVINTVSTVLVRCEDQELEPESDREEVGDIQICLWAYSESKKYSTQFETDRKMSINRERTLEECQARFRKKQDQGLKFIP